MTIRKMYSANPAEGIGLTRMIDPTLWQYG